MRPRVLIITSAIITACGLALLLEVPARLFRTLGEFEHHRRLSYALAFLTAPQSELRPAAWETDCTTGCIEFDVDADDAATLDATLEFDDGTVTHPLIVVQPMFSSSERLRFDLALETPTDVWLTWKPESLDPAYGVEPPPCGQALSTIGVRPSMVHDGRVGVKLTLAPRGDFVEQRLHGPQPFVP